VLYKAIADGGRVALARAVIGQRERTIAIRAMAGGLVSHTLDEQRDIKRVYLYPGARIGQEGFSFASNEAGSLSILQLGRDIVEDAGLLWKTMSRLVPIPRSIGDRRTTPSSARDGVSITLSKSDIMSGWGIVVSLWRRWGLRALHNA
jgi:hypothetical protein